MSNEEFGDMVRRSATQIPAPTLDLAKVSGRKVSESSHKQPAGLMHVISIVGVSMLVVALTGGIAVVVNERSSDTSRTQDRPNLQGRSEAPATSHPSPAPIPSGDARVSIRPWTPAELPAAIPPSLQALKNRLTGLVEAHPRALSGIWYEPGANTLFIGALDPEGTTLLAAENLTTEPDLEIAVAPRGFAQGQELALELLRDPRVQGIVTESRPNEQGDGFVIAVAGDDVPSDVMRTISRALPGWLTIFTGMEGGVAGVGGR